ncbi:MAG: SGNH/GDSL hydrolase family protein [bacterium]|nr:SGNH/GDSL hydrolase family protein [bacterium]
MALPDRKKYLVGLVEKLKKQWPDNKTINIVCHGHSVPAGYFATPYVDTFNAYPHLLHKKLKERFPFAVINVIVTAIGGENSVSGAKRFSTEVLNHNPELVLIDYGLNDRKLDENVVCEAWKKMIRVSKEKSIPVILLTPSWDVSVTDGLNQDSKLLKQRTSLIRKIAFEEEVGLADSFAAFERAVSSGMALEILLSWSNHPSKQGHLLIVNEILSWFPF